MLPGLFSNILTITHFKNVTSFNVYLIETFTVNIEDYTTIIEKMHHSMGLAIANFQCLFLEVLSQYQILSILADNKGQFYGKTCRLCRNISSESHAFLHMNNWDSQSGSFLIPVMILSSVASEPVCLWNVLNVLWIFPWLCLSYIVPVPTGLRHVAIKFIISIYSQNQWKLWGKTINILC